MYLPKKYLNVKIEIPRSHYGTFLVQSSISEKVYDMEGVILDVIDYIMLILLSDIYFSLNFAN